MALAPHERYGTSETARSRGRDPEAGFDIIEAESLDEAVRIAEAHPMSALGTIEVRAFLEEG